MAWLHKFSNFQQRSYQNGRWQNKGIRNHDKTDRHWDYFGQKAWGETRTSQQKEKKKEASFDKRMAPKKGHVWSIWYSVTWTKQRGPQVLQELPPCWCWLVSGVCETCRATNNQLCSKYSVVSRWQQVVVFSVVFECCMIIHELCTDVETVSGRTWPCIIRTGTVLVVWRSYETVLVVWRSYKTVCTLVWIVRWSCDIRVLIRVLDVGLGNGFTRFHTIYIRYWHGWAHSWSGLHVRLYIRPRTVSHGLSRSCTIANTIIHGHGTRARFLKILKIIHGFHGYTRMARV